LDNVEQVIRSFHATGLYTHVYAACGFLDGKGPAFETSILPDERSIFDLASLTKAFVTTPLVLGECFRGNIAPEVAQLGDLFGDSIGGEFGQEVKNLLVANILRHEAGLPAWRNLYVECEGRRQTLLSAVQRAKGIGQNQEELYSDIGFMILGEMLQHTAKKSLANLSLDFLRELGVENQGYIGSSDIILREKVIPTGYCAIRSRQLIGEVHDENAWALGGFAGHAGLFGTGPAVVDYLQALWRSPVGRRAIEANFHAASSSGESLMGWRKGRDASAKTFAQGRGCGHLGFTGTAFWVDPLTGGFGVVLTNRVVSGRISTAIKDMRAQAFSGLWDILQKKSKA
jgi:CubicO group peptidase (beta-lactamase class C family)